MEQRRTVLLADTSTEFRILLREAMERTGEFLVEIAQTGDEVLDKVQEQEPDILIMDVILPGLDGLSALRELQELGYAPMTRMGLWTLWDVPCTYPLLERMKLEVAAAGGVVRDAEYGADITLHAAFPAGGAERFQAKLTELSAGSLSMTAAGEEFLPGPREEAL